MIGNLFSRKTVLIMGVLYILSSCTLNNANDSVLFNLKTKNHAHNTYYAWSREKLNKEKFPSRTLDDNVRQYNWFITTDFNLNANKGKSCLQSMIFLHRFYAANPSIIEPVIFADKVYGYFEAYSHNRLIYSYPADKNFNSRNATMHIIHVQPRWAVYDSHVVKFRFYPDESGRMGFHGKILFGSQRAILNHLIRNVMPLLAAAFCLLIASIAFLVISIIRRKKKNIFSLTIPASLCLFWGALALTINKKVFFVFFDFSFPFINLFTLVFIILLFISLALLLVNLFKKKNSKETEKKEEIDFLKQYNITEREKEILTLVFQGKSSKEIGDVLFISPRTVDNHLYNIYQKTNTKNRIQLIKILQESGIF